MRRYFIGGAFITLIAATIGVGTHFVNGVSGPGGSSSSPVNDSIRLVNQYKALLIDSIVRRQFDKYHFNGSVLVADNGKVIYENTLGFADYKEKVPMQDNPVFQLASVSKQFTAMGILILASRHELDVNDDVRKYIPDLPYSGITIKNLLQHTSGLPEYVNEGVFDRYLPKGYDITNADLIRIMAEHHLHLEFKPGSRHKYSNTGYAMLGTVIENVSGTTYGKFIKENIFDPLEMTNTYTYSVLTSCTCNELVSPCSQQQGKTARLNNVVGDKGIFSCAKDMYKWDQALYTDKLVNTSLLDEAFTKGVTTKGDTFSYGYGWRIHETDLGTRLIMHRGLWQTYNPAILRFVDAKKTIIILDNIVPPFSCSVLINDITKVLFQKPDSALANMMAPEPLPGQSGE